MTGRDDDAPKPGDPRRSAIPAGLSVPRPSKPPPAPAPMLAGPGVAAPQAPRAARPDSGAAGPEGSFDPERTIVVEGEEDPTSDYDPRLGSYDPRARGVFTAPAPAPLPTIPDYANPERANPERANPERANPERAPGYAGPEYASPAPVAPRVGGDRAIPAPRPSESGRRRSSRRTVRIPDDRVLRGEGTPTPVAAATEPVANTPRPASAGYAEFLEEPTDEITIVRPHRIINVGDSSAPPAPTKAQATWPPSARPATPAFGTKPAPPVAPAGSSAASPPPAAPRRSPTGEHADPRSDRQPPAIPSVSQPPPMPAAPTFGAPPVPVVAAQSPIAAAPPLAAPPVAAPPVVAPPVVAPPAPPLESDTLEIDRSEFVEVVDAPPKRPPPPKARSARAEGRGGETKPVDAPKGKPWWEDLWKGDAIRTFEPLDAATAKREVDFLEESLGVRQGARVLDLACGFGEHALEFAARGYDLVGFDLSRDMLAVAEQGARARYQRDTSYVPPTLMLGDMRELGYQAEFDAAYCWGSSFGFFEEDKNALVLHNLRMALKERGTLVIEVANRDFVAAQSPSLVWFEGQRCVCIDDMYVDFLTSRLKVKRTAMFEGGGSREIDYSMRLYSLHELGKLLRKTGFRVVQASGHVAHRGAFFGAESARLIVLAERA
jgi:SAM-dependent methyltransferase